MASTVRIFIVIAIVLLVTDCVAESQEILDVQHHLSKALEALQKHDDATADGELGLVIAADPRNAEAHIARGILFYREGKWPDADQELRRGLELKPEDARADAFQALTRAAMGKCSEALPTLRRILKGAAKGDLQRLTGLGLVQCQLSLNQIGDATSSIHELRQSYPRDPDMLYQAAHVYSALWEQSVLALFKVAPDSWQFHRISGEVLESQDRFSDAAIEYRKALSINPRVPGLHFRLGRCLLLSSHEPSSLDQAQEQFGEELAVNPLDAASQYELGQIAWTRHELDPALQNFQRAVELDPQLVDALVGVAKIFLEKKEPEKAIPVLEKAIGQAPSSEAARYVLMIAYRNAGRDDDAKRAQDDLQKVRDAEQADDLDDLMKRWQQDEKGQPSNSPH